MYLLGAEKHELARCLSDSKKKLVAAGASADNLPVGTERQIRFLTILQPKAEAVVHDWFRTHSVFAAEPDATEAVERIQSALPGEMNPDAAKLFWRAILRAHVSQEPTEAVEIFLAGAEASNEAVPHKETVPVASGSIEITDEDADICIAIAEGKECSWRSRPLPALIFGIAASVRGEDHLAKECQSELAKDSHPLARKFGRTISAFEAWRPQKAERSVVRKAPLLIAGQIDHVDQVSFIGIVKKVLPSGQAFVGAVALFVDAEWAELSFTQTKDLFPSSGDATAFPNLIARHFTEGEIGVWTAELRSPDKSTQYVITSYLARVYSVVDIPHSSQEPDAIREWMKSVYKPNAGAIPVFHLSDGVALRFPGELADPNKFDFDMPLYCYHGLQPLELAANRMLLVPQLPPTPTKFDCAPAGTLIKRLLKHGKDADGFPALTRVQIQALANFANSNGSGVDALTFSRALENLKEVAAAKEFLSGAVNQILDLPQIKIRIDAEIASITEGYADEQKSLKAEIGDLLEKRRSIEADIESKREAAQTELERLKKVARQQEGELEKRIKSTFEKASKEGLETLTKSSLLRAILVGKSSAPLAIDWSSAEPQALQREPHVPADIFPQGCKRLVSKSELISQIESEALASGLSETMLLTAVAAACLHPLLGILGRNARETIVAMARFLAGGVLCEVSVTGDMFGVSDLMNAPALVRSGIHAWPTTLGDFLDGQRKAGWPSVVELRGVNRVPPETLLPELAEPLTSENSAGEICWKDRTGSLRHTSLSIPTIFALTFASGKSVFPLQGSLATELPVIWADGPWGDEPEATEPAMVLTSIASEVWRSFAKGASFLEKGSGKPQRMLRATATHFGFSEEKADALSSLVFGAGRRSATRLKSEVERLAPELSAYAQEVVVGSAARMLACMFHDDKVEADE